MQDCLARLISPGPFKWKLRYVAHMAELLCKCGGSGWYSGGTVVPRDPNFQFKLVGALLQTCPLKQTMYN